MILNTIFKKVIFESLKTAIENLDLHVNQFHGECFKARVKLSRFTCDNFAVSLSLQLPKVIECLFLLFKPLLSAGADFHLKSKRNFLQNVLGRHLSLQRGSRSRFLCL